MNKKTLLAIVDSPFCHSVLLEDVLPNYFGYVVDVVTNVNDAIPFLDQKYDKILISLYNIELGNRGDMKNIPNDMKSIPNFGEYFLEKIIRDQDSKNLKTPVVAFVIDQSLNNGQRQFLNKYTTNVIDIPSHLHDMLKALDLNSNDYKFDNL
jgi:hypothetical protein